MRLKLAITFFLGVVILLHACVSDYPSSANQSSTDLIRTTGKTIETRVLVPIDYERVKLDTSSFGFYLRNFKLKPNGTKALLYNGQEKANQGVVQAVLDIDVGTRDLQQCADAVMRLRAEYLFSKKRFSDIHFNFTNGFKADYTKYAEGNRIRTNGNTITWVKTASKDYSYATFKAYLQMIFNYAGTLSLSRELKAIPISEIQVGDVFIHGGSPGHAVIVMDVAEHKNNHQKIFLIAQSYMPAQSVHLLKNINQSTISPWYDVSRMTQVYSPEWTFEKTELKRFQ